MMSRWVHSVLCWPELILTLRKRLVLPSWLQTCGFDLFHLPPCRGPWVPSCSPFQLWLQQPPTIHLTSFKFFIHCPPIWVPAVLNVATQRLCHPCGMGEIWTQLRWYPSAVHWAPFSPAARLRVENTEKARGLETPAEPHRPRPLLFGLRVRTACLCRAIMGSVVSVAMTFHYFLNGCSQTKDK